MKYYCINSILWLTLIIIAATHVKAVRISVCPDPYTGEHAPYDISSQICCGGKVYSVNQNTRAICCGKRHYNPSDEICCGGEVRSRSSGFKCCNFEAWYNSTLHMCCGDEVHSRHHGVHKCCGSERYNTEKETCCPIFQEEESRWGHREPVPGVGHCCGNTVIDPSEEICCSGVANIRISLLSQCCGNSTYNMMSEECCGNQTPFDPYSQLCCSGEVRQIGSGARCCGSGAYNPSQSSCCHDNIFNGIPEVPGIQACCGGVSYFKTDQVCCDGTLHDRGENTGCCGQESYNTSTHLCCGLADQTVTLEKMSPADQCCGMSTYNPNRQTCCEAASRSFDVVNGECCGTSPDQVKVFDPASGTCCRGIGGEIFYRDAPTNQSRCCGSYLLSENDLCNPLDDTLVPKTMPVDDAICQSADWINARTYNSQTQICMPDGNIEELSESVALCGLNVYDPQAEVCCEGFIRGRFDENGKERDCCPGTIISFSPATQTCCVGNVHDIPSEQSSCCRTQAYNTATHICDISGLVRSLEEAANFPSMCGATPYNPDDFSCCMGYLVRPGQICCQGVLVALPVGVTEGECCGFSGYDPESEICCDGVTLHKQGEDSTCCGQEILADPIDQICCSGSVYHRRSGRTICEGSTAYDPEVETVCSGVVFPVANVDCCGVQVYDDTTDVCCNGHLHPLTNITMGCCGNEIYDKEDSSLLCCDGHLQHDATERECCGDFTFDPKTKHCCQTQESSIILLNDSTSTQSILTCCDVNNYHSFHHTCCGGIEHKYVVNGECCGIDLVRSPQEEICCGGQVWSRYYGEYTECCGGQQIDTRFASCCNDRIITSGYEECCGGEVIHNFLQSCCGGKVYSNSNTTIGCCQGTTYNIKTQGCCTGMIYDASISECNDEGFVAPLPVDSMVARSTERVAVSFCGDIQYNTDIQSCCGNFIYVHSENLICCEGRLWDASIGKTACCAHMPYNPNNYDCCEGAMHDKIEGAECCGTSYIQPSKETCCSDHVVVSHLLGELCPGSSDVFSLHQGTGTDSQCFCAVNTRNQGLPAACLATLKTKQSIIIGTVEAAAQEDSDGELCQGESCLWRLKVPDVLRGRRPTHHEDGTVHVLMSAEHNCHLSTLRSGRKVAVFTNAADAADGMLRLSRNDVVLAYNKKLARRLRDILTSYY